MKRIIRKLHDSISYWRSDDFLAYPKDKDFIISLNQYFFLLSVIFLLHGMFFLLFLGFSADVIVLFGVSISFCLFFILPIKILINRYFILSIFIILTNIVTYYSSLCGIESGTFLFYFPLLSAVHIFFSWKTQKYFVIFLLVFILSNLYLSAGSNFTLVVSEDRYIDFRHILLMLNISCMFSILTLNSYFFTLKRDEYYFTLNINLYKREQIENLKNELVRVRELINADDITEESLKHLVESAQINDALFVEKFNKFSPDFYNKINSASSVPLTLSDLKYCGMLKLGFTTKQIAIYTNSSIKSVESKKYRLRKKLAIQIDENSKDWFSTI